MMLFKLKDRISELKELASKLTDGFSVPGIVSLVADFLLALIVIIVVLKLFKIKLKDKKIVASILVIVLGLGISYVIGFRILLGVFVFLAFCLFGFILIIYSNDIKEFFEKGKKEVINSRAFSSEEDKQRVIDTLVKTADYLSHRKTGALITIEGKDSLDNIINKSIAIESIISQDILTTLFYVGTVTHDGAVIIRKNVIKCAGAYLPSTDRYDIPKELGTRHRAAIGISEKCDAVTIVVSEETGSVSVTVNGGIERNLSSERLQEILEQYLIVK